ncbi:hypothetical protein EVAR_96859_1 [Eumeta japonica]|uniref:Uncharacterized protein n=1 Tax=Eumeta variegata TaxID=151549 RepID=A0A4C1WMS4_EUMVA|nr:hypothetical protein EVAR_96859_1 [Eumeta japonica]
MNLATCVAKTGSNAGGLCCGRGGGRRSMPRLPLGACARRSLSISAVAFLRYTVDECRGGRLRIDIGATREECCGEAMTCAVQRSLM